MDIAVRINIIARETDVGVIDMMKPYTIRETTDFYPLSVLFHDCGMEIEITHDSPLGAVKMWRLEDRETGELLAAVTMEIRDGVYVLGSLGVRPDQQRTGYGKIMQNVVFDEARKMGLSELWGSAKVPDYYYPIGWKRMDWDSSPRIAVHCHDCSHRGKTCFPEILKIELS